MNGVITMTKKNLETLKVMALLSEKKLTQIEAGKRLRLTDRQIRNIFNRYKEFGNQGVISRKLGKAGNRQLPKGLKDKALSLIKTTYEGFGPTLAAEKLLENHNIKLSVETIRNMMISHHLWIPAQPRKKIHKLRSRRAHFGELIQVDGSEHRWFEDRGPPCSLIVMIDDATSTLLSLLFSPTENLNAYFQSSKEYFKKEGCPLAMYSDRFSVFEVARKNPLQEEQALTQFKRALGELDINLICAKTPQAKGRVERVNRTLQDRLVKEFRLLGISNIEEANIFLQKSDYIIRHNAKFAIPPAQRGNVHRTMDKEQLSRLDRILSRNYERVIQKDLSFQYGGDIYQIISQEPRHDLCRKKVIVWEDDEKKIRAQIGDEELQIRCMKEIEYLAKTISDADLSRIWKTKKKYIPSNWHPYKRKYKINETI